jgi:heterodisulfide reductase subunit C
VFLRDLLGAILLAGVAAAAYRRFVARPPRRPTSGADTYAIVLLAVIGLSGILLGAAKIGSYSSFRSMVDTYAAPADAAPLEAYWVARMGTVSAAPHRPELVERGRELHEAACAACHASPRAAFVVDAVAAVLRPVSLRLDAAGGARVLWVIHFYACIVGLALLPFTKMFHLVATPISLLAAAAGDRRTADPANAATLRALHLDACTHCCACSVHCSMAVASDVYGNANVLPSEKMAALRSLRSGRALEAGELRAVQDGVCLCTSCERCTVACPSGIDLVGLWASAKEALLARGEPAYALLSPLSLRRGLSSDRLEPAAYRAAVERPRQAIASHFGTAALADRTVALQAGNGRLLAALGASSRTGGAGSCFGCKTCTTACPVVREHAEPQQALGLLPHQVVYSARLGLEGLVLGSRMLWDCLGCYQCQELCPQGVGVTDVMYQLKNVAIAQAAGLAGADRPAAAPARGGRAA